MKYLIALLLLVVSSAHAESYALYHYGTSQYIDSQAVTEQRSIASITKLFTANTILKSNLKLNDIVPIVCDRRGKVSNGARMSIRDLLIATIVASDNCAAEALANAYPGGSKNFTDHRNQYIFSSGLTRTSIHDATGLSIFNVSTVEDLIKFINVAYQNETMRLIANLPKADVTLYKKNKKHVIHLHNTNPAIFKHNNILLSKTGFTNSAGRCVVMIIDRSDNMYAVVVLGEQNVLSRTRTVEKLLAYENSSKRNI
jgi:D-alanyl-D-alanine endopeptidase (penicillin-binding protein 7)